MKAQRYNAYDVQVASKTDPAARYVLATDYAKLEADGNRRELDLYSAGCELNEMLDAMRADVLQIVDNFDPTWPEDVLRKLRAILEPETTNG